MTLVIFIFLSALSFAQLSQPKMTAKIDGWQMWYSYVIDSTWLGVNNDTLSAIGGGQFGYDVPRRVDGTYLMWLFDGNGLIRRRTYRKIIPLFMKPLFKKPPYTIMELTK